MGWRDRAVKVQEDETPMPGWKARAVPVEEGPSKAASFGLGAAEGATFGFGDELAGAANAIGLDPANGDLAQGLTLQAIKYLKGEENPVDKYREARDFVRSKMAAAKEANPKTFLGGQFTGGAATMLIPGAAPARGAKLAQIIKAGALAGGAQGLGSSEADLTRGDVLGAADDTAKGAALGAIISGGIHAVPKAGRFLLDKAGQVVENVAGLPHWLARVARRDGPEIFNAAGTEESVSDAVGSLQSKVSSYRKNAADALSAVRKDLGVAGSLDDVADDIAAHGVSNPTEQEVVRKVQGLLSNNAPEGRDMLRAMVDARQEIDDLVKFSNQGLSPVGTKTTATLKYLRSLLNDKIGTVTETPMAAERSAMGVPTGMDVPVGPTRAIGSEFRNADKAFAGAAETFEALQPQLDTTGKVVNRVKADLQEGLRSINPDLRQIENVPGGPEAWNSARNEVARFLFKTTDPNGGGTLTLLAKTLGLTPDRAGRFLAASGKGLDDFIAAHPKALTYFQALSNSAARGGQSMAVANFVLQQREPDYQKMLNDLNEGGN